MDKSDKCMYWYKLRKDFFKQSKIMVLRKKYNVNVLLFYLNLMCESIATLGVLCDEDGGGYSAEMLAIMAQTTVNWVEKSLPVLQELKLITVQPNGTIIVNEVQDNLGETSAQRTRKYRAKRTATNMDNPVLAKNNVTSHVTTDIEIETEIDTELDTDGEGDIDSRQSVSDGIVNAPTPIVGGDSSASCNISAQAQATSRTLPQSCSASQLPPRGSLEPPTPIVDGDSRASCNTTAQAQGTVPPTPTIIGSTGRGGVAPSSNTTTVNQASGVILSGVEGSRQPAVSSQQPQRQASITEGGGTTCRDGRSRQASSRTLPQSCSASQPSAQVASIALLPALATNVPPAHRLHASRPPRGSLEPSTPSVDRSTDRGNAVQALLKDTARRMDIKTFVPPSYDDVASYIKKKGYTVDPKRFIYYYTANGWMISKNPMRNWQAAVDSWQLKEQPSCTQGNYTFNNTPRTPPVDRVIVGGVDVERRTYTDEQLESLFATLDEVEDL